MRSDTPKPNWDLATIMVLAGAGIGAQPLVVCINAGQPVLGAFLWALFFVAGCLMAAYVWRP